jgi:Ca-activated chloride channel family protein
MTTRHAAQVLVVSALLSPALAHAQAQERTIYAGVTDRAGAPITSLAAGDFIVREDGTPREVLRVATASDPMQIAVLVDTSQAMDPYIGDLRRGLRAFFRAMNGKHEIALFAFGERPTLLVDYTRDLQRLEAGIGRVFAQSNSASYLLDAIIETARGLSTREGGRAAIVAVTAEGPELSGRDHQTVLDEVEAARATLHSLVLTRTNNALLTQAAREREFALAKGAEATGGRRDDLLTSMAIAHSMEALAAEMLHQYEIVYARPTTLLPPERVDVKVSRPDAMVRAHRTAPAGRSRS